MTRFPLKLKEVRREVPVGAAAAIVSGVEPDPQVEHLKRLEEMNLFFCNCLDLHGMDGSQLRKEAPKRSTYVAVTAPISLERVKAIKNAKTTGQLFFATGGRHTNSEEFFKAREMKHREPEIQKMEEQKKARSKYCKEQRDAVMMIKEKGELTYETVKGFTVAEIGTLLKWKKIKMPASKKKRDLVDAYIAAPKPKIQKVWCRSEEEALLALKSEHIAVKDTALGVATSQMARAVSTNLDQLDEESLSALKTALYSLEEAKSDNVI
jgi:hypothetical protein